VFDLAYFWRVSPLVIQALPISELYEWEDQAIRINQQLHPDSDG
jgi:hypothetical protein